jgi:predicted small lipoprotein YifL
MVYGALVSAMIVAALALSACGRKGPLEAPPAAVVTAPAPDATTDGKPTKPNKPFFLDSLL